MTNPPRNWCIFRKSGPGELRFNERAVKLYHGQELKFEVLEFPPTRVRVCFWHWVKLKLKFSRKLLSRLLVTNESKFSAN